MICLSKADEGAFKHLAFNQSPSPLAAEHTTCQDLNGIANLREHVAADQDDDSGGGLCHSSDADEKWQHGEQPPGPVAVLTGARWWSTGLSSYLKASGGDDQNCLNSVTPQTWISRIWGWVTWLLSVLVFSFLLNTWNARGTSIPASTAASCPTDATTQTFTPQVSHQIPRAEPLRRRSTCDSGGVSGDEYNMPLHVGALLIIWFISTLACMFPILARKLPGLRFPPTFFFIVRHFGTGVLIATAFVHLLPTAFISLGNQCLGGFWVKDFPAMPGAIALAAIFLVTIIEMVFHPGRHCTLVEQAPSGGVCATNGPSAEDQDESACSDTESPVPMRDMAPPRGRSTSMSYGLNRLHTARESTEDEDDEQQQREQEAERGIQAEKKENGEPLVRVQTLSPEQKLRKERLQCILLELGILFHSIFIGMALSVAIGNDFVVLLIAIVFHQTFEGLALGSRISNVKWNQNKMQPWLMAIAYGCTTPLGQAIGIATHTLYTPNSEVGLIVTGVMNAISAGLLTFASLVELMSEDFLSDESWKYLRGRKRVFACLLVFLGALGMSLVGAWA